MDLNSDSRLSIEWWPIENVIPYARNPRKLGAAAVAKVAASLAEFGWRQPIVVDAGGVVIVGHTRLLAAQSLSESQVPVHVAGGLSEAQAKAYRLADNRTAAENSWDLELLPLEIADLQLLDSDLALLGFDPDELAALATPAPSPGLTDPDEIPPLPEEPVSRPGDLWLLGQHKLVCGDSTDVATVARLMAGERAALMATDPPYLVDYDGGNHPQTWRKTGTLKASARSAEEKTRHWDAYTDHDQAVGFYSDFMAAAIAEALGQRPAIYQWFGMLRMGVVEAAWAANQVKLHQVLIWHKSRPVLGRCWYMWDYEPCAVGWLEGRQPEARRRPPAATRTVWPVDQREGVEEGLGCVHPTIKPVELIRRPIEWHTVPGELIYEPFCGSGTAIMAAQSTGRRCNAIECSPAFVDVAIRRWQAFSGEAATLAGDGRSFETIAAERESQ